MSAEELLVKGVVIRDEPIGEYDKRLVLLTAQLGKITVFASGCRRPNSPLLAVARTFVFAEFSLRSAKTYRLLEAKVIAYFDELTKDLEKISYGSYFLEIASYFAGENLPMPEELNLLFVTLKALGRGAVPPWLIRIVFEIRLITIAGEGPEVSVCLGCGKAVEEDAFFSLKDKGCCCESCKNLRYRNAVPASHSLLYLVRLSEGRPLGKLFSFSVTEALKTELVSFWPRYRKLYFPEGCKSLKLLDLFQD